MSSACERVVSDYAMANTMMATMNAMDRAKTAIAANPSLLVLSCAEGSFGVRIRNGLIRTGGRDVRFGTLVPEPADREPIEVVEQP